MKIIFMGGPEFSVEPLLALINSGSHEVVAIFSGPPKPKGRGLKHSLSRAHEIGIELNIPVYTPEKLRTEESINLVKSIEADIIIVVAYGLIVPKALLWDKKYGAINLHPSDLPKHRGAAPLQRTIIEGEEESAVCIIQMDEGIDTGDIILQEKFELSPKITLQELSRKCSILGSKLCLEALEGIDSLPRIKQAEDGSSYAAKLSKEEGKLDFFESACSLERKIRGMNPWPGAYFEYGGENLKMFEADYSEEVSGYAPGTVIGDKLEIACGSGILLPKKLQRPGKKPLPVEEFLLGFGIPKFSVLK